MKEKSRNKGKTRTTSGGPASLPVESQEPQRPLIVSSSDDHAHLDLASGSGSIPTIKIETIETEKVKENSDSEPLVEDTDDELDTLKKVQDAINVSHPFGLKIWKPALYKKSRSVNRTVEECLHSKPGVVEAKKLYLYPGNLLWSLFFGWWISLLYVLVAILLLGPWYILGQCMNLIFRPSTRHGSLSESGKYIQILLKMALYILWPFGKYITRQQAVIEQSDFFRDPTEQDPLLRADNASSSARQKSDKNKTGGPVRRWFQRLQRFGLMGRIFYFTYLLFIAPIHVAVTVLCFFMIFPIPMGKLNFLLMRHLLWHPLELTLHSCFFIPPTPSDISSTTYDYSSLDPSISTHPNVLHRIERPRSTLYWRQSQSGLIGAPLLSSLEAGFACDNESVVLCIYKAVGVNYYKYTLDGINILVINMLSVVVFTIFDYYYLVSRMPDSWLTAPGLLFSFSLVSTIPLAFFIGMAVSSITAQTGSIALGSVINATFGSIIEIILYCLAIVEGKERMVEGAIIGSMLCGLLALPGASMFSGGLIRKEQTFNAKAAGVSTTMLVMAVIGVFSPTIFQMIYGSIEMRCHPCHVNSTDSSCQKCVYIQPHPTNDPVYMNRTRPFMYVCTVALVLTYAIGLWFTLRTHTKKIYAPHKKKTKRTRSFFPFTPRKAECVDPILDPVRVAPAFSQSPSMAGGVMAESKERPRSVPVFQTHVSNEAKSESIERSPASFFTPAFSAAAWEEAFLGFLGRRGPESSHGSDSESDEEHSGGHDHPNWSNFKSTLILLGCTVLYSLIAEVLIGSVDGFLSHFPLDEKILGLTLFAIAPTVTEFYNAISFAVSGNIALSLEIGSAYAIQVALLQIPALVLFSSWFLGQHTSVPESLAVRNIFPGKMLQEALHQVTFGLYPTLGHAQSHLKVRGFTLIFPRWDLASIIFAVFILSYIYVEGKSNYFKGAMLLLAYGVLLSGFLFVPTGDDIF